MGVSSGQDPLGTLPGSHQPGTPVMLIAHRGESFIAPENTQAAFRLAWESGAETVELDCHLSADHRVVVLHDGNSPPLGVVFVTTLLMNCSLLTTILIINFLSYYIHLVCKPGYYINRLSND
jgi:glycerophosphoryl diester phosphodiesterase